MSQQNVSVLSLAELVDMINAGGWYFRRAGHPEDTFIPIQHAEFLMTLLVLDDTHVTEASAVVHQNGTVGVQVPGIRREQKKKIDGGGWRDIPTTRTVHSLWHETHISAYRDELVRARAERVARQEAEERRVAEERAEAARRREESERQRVARGAVFLASLNHEMKGRRLSLGQPIQLEGQTLTLTFDDGEKLEIALFDAGEDWYHVESSLVLNGISAHSFEKHEGQRW